MLENRISSTVENLDQKKRKQLLQKKLTSLYKKAHELSILCDVKVVIISFTPDVFAWPSAAEANNIVNDYLGCPKTQREYKLVTHEANLQQNVKEDVRKLEQMAEEKEMENLLNQLAEGRIMVDEFDVRQIKGLLKLFAVKKAELHQRRYNLMTTMLKKRMMNVN